MNTPISFSQFVYSSDLYLTYFYPPRAQYTKTDQAGRSAIEELLEGVRSLPEDSLLKGSVRTVGRAIFQVAVVLPASVLGIAVHGVLLCKAERRAEKMQAIFQDALSVLSFAMAILPALPFFTLSIPVVVAVGLVSLVAVRILIGRSVERLSFVGCNLDQPFYHLAKTELGLTRSDIFTLFGEGEDRTFAMEGDRFVSPIAHHFARTAYTLMAEESDLELKQSMENILANLFLLHRLIEGRLSFPYRYLPESDCVLVETSPR